MKGRDQFGLTCATLMASALSSDAIRLELLLRLLFEV